MPELEWLQSELKARNITLVCMDTGLSAPTVRAVRDGKGNPTLATLNKLAAYLQSQSA